MKNINEREINYNNFQETRELDNMVGNQPHRIYPVVDRYFAVANINTYYLAGFIHGDGNITKPQEGHGINRRLIIEISQKDKSLLETLKYMMRSESPIKTRIDDRPRYKNGPSVTERIEIGSNEMCEDLIYYFSIVPAKSLIVEPPPLIINWYNMPLIIAFIRGIIDANGSIGINKQFPEKLDRIRLATASKSFADWVHHIIYRWWLPNIESKGIYISKKNENSAPLYSIELNGLRAAIVYNILYTVPVPYNMERKWQVETQDLNNFKVIKSRPTFPKIPYTNDYKPNYALSCDHHGYFEDFNDKNKIDPLLITPDKNGVLWPNNINHEEEKLNYVEI